MGVADSSLTSREGPGPVSEAERVLGTISSR